NNMVYNIHLLTGKISTPGNSPFSLTGQPSACGTAREVGTFSHRLPADMLVANPEHRQHAEEIWKLPRGLLNPKPGYHAVEQNRALKDGLLNAYWVQVNNNMQAGANLLQETWPGYRNPENFIVVTDAYPTVTAQADDLILPAAMWVEKEGAYGNAYWVQVNNNMQAGANLLQETWPGYRSPENFIVVSDAYPTVTAQAADLILPASMWVENEGAYGNAERRTQFWHQLVQAPGEARSGLWQLMEFSRRFTTDECWPKEILDANPAYRGKTLFEVLFANGKVDAFPLSDIEQGYANQESRHFGFYVQKGLFEEYAEFGRGHGHDLAPFDAYHQARGLRWPVVDGKETRWRYREGSDPYVKAGTGFQFYGNKDGKAVIWALPYEPPAEAPDD